MYGEISSTGTIAARAQQLEQAARFTRTLTRYMADTEAQTAGEALARLQASNHLQQSEWERALGSVETS